LSLPNWFILQPPPNLDIDVERWKRLAWERVQLLEQLPHNPSQVIRDNFPTYDDALDQIYDNYRLGAYLLRLVAATNRRLEAWLIESEGDLFEQLYFDRTDSKDQKMAIYKKLFGSDNVMEYEEYKYKMDEEQNENLAKLYHEIHSSRGRVARDFLICVHFSQVPWMVSNRKGYLRKGWIVSNEISFRGSLKKAFESKLQDEIEKAQNLLGVRENIDQVVQEIEQNLSKHAQIRSQFAADDFEGRDLYSHPEVFPPCMINLYFEFERTGRLTHTHRLQLGFFLKKVGMSVEEQMQYWFEKSVDNVGISFTEFQRTSGYQIRHLYGLEGGKKDYEVPKCSTIATSYFCPFVHLAPALLIKFLSTNYLTQKKSRVPSEKQLEKIVTQSANNPTEACTSYFPLIYGKPSYRKIVHPLQWARVAMKLEGLVKEPETQNPAMNQEKREDQ
jgi:DNA primase large subunit